MRVMTLTAFSVIMLGGFTAGVAAAEDANQAILNEFAEDYVHDVTLKTARTFGVEIGDDFYTVSVDPEGDGAWEVTQGAPADPTFYFTLQDERVLATLVSGEKNALTLMAKAFSSDVTPMDMEVQEGFEPDENFLSEVLSTAFHFWTMGKPEIVKFSPEATRFTHGANMGVFYYQPGFRSGWFSIDPGHHVNEDENSRTNPFPTLMILIEGSITARIDGSDMEFSAGEAMMIPPEVSHEFLNQSDASAFGFLFMFGDGA